MFIRAYSLLGLPFTAESLIVGVAAVMTFRFTIGFLAEWFRTVYHNPYQREIRHRLFEALAYAPIE